MQLVRKMTLKYLICNLKAHKTLPEILKYQREISTIPIDNMELIIAPSNIYLPLFQSSNISLCAQNIDLYENLALTGDITIEQLKSCHVKYSIVGHYERKKYYHESETDIINKIKLALNNNLKVIYCIGETYEEMARKVHYQTLERAIARILNKISCDDFKNIIIAYEPTYMIGGEIPLDFKQISDNINFIKNLIDNYYHEDIKVIYGGNINSENIKNFLKIKSLDGFIIGSSSLDVSTIKDIIYTIND